MNKYKGEMVMKKRELLFLDIRCEMCKISKKMFNFQPSSYHNH